MSDRKILVIDDDKVLSGIIQEFLEDKKYTVCTAHTGKSGIAAAIEQKPNLIILDLELPDMKGYDVCREMRKMSALRHVPVIMLTARSGENEEVKGLQAGADDFLGKPFQPKRLLARIDAVIGRTTNQLEANALTHLPGNIVIFNEIASRIVADVDFSVFYMDLNNFKAFNDRYGFLRGDEAIKLTSEILLQCFEKSKLAKPFLGHVGGDDFVGVVNSHEVESLCRKIIRDFDGGIPQLYDDKDQLKGQITSIDRKGRRVDFPLMGLAVAVVTNKKKSFRHPGQISLVAGDLKKWVKSQNQSSYVIDRRS